MHATSLFKQAEDEYFVLRGKLELGRITRDQFETALHDLMLEDTQGWHWMLGVDSGRWFVHDGQAWVGADPYSAGVAGKRVVAASPVAPARKAAPSVPVTAPGATPTAVAKPKPKTGIGCVRIGCTLILGFVFVIVAIVAVLYFRVPQQLGLLPSAQRAFADTPDRAAAIALRDELTKAGIDTRGMGIYVLPYRDKPGSVVYITLDSAQGFKFKSGSKDPVVDYFKQIAQSGSAKQYDIRRLAMEYKSPAGISLLSLTASTDTITAFANGAINRSEFLKKLDGQANWVGFYQEVLK
ncbi:MAG: hypothetical protein HZC40_13425 [Chloroflexi bacterium]|nr:hypothetical protein [Chloroflexota bacterium]